MVTISKVGSDSKQVTVSLQTQNLSNISRYRLFDIQVVRRENKQVASSLQMECSCKICCLDNEMLQL
jgi:hypothetical protein